MFIRAAVTNESKGDQGDSSGGARILARKWAWRESHFLAPFFRLEQFAADQILLKNFDASNIE